MNCILTKNAPSARSSATLIEGVDMKQYKLQNGPVFLLGNEPSLNLIVLVDLKKGRSITNAAEAICQFLVGMFGEDLVEKRQIAYRDTENRWDILKTRKNGVFSSFAPGDSELSKICNSVLEKWSKAKA